MNCETAHPGYLGSQDTFYVGNLKGVGRIYQQTFIDNDRTHQGKVCCGRTPMDTLIDGKPIWVAKNIAQI